MLITQNLVCPKVGGKVLMVLNYKNKAMPTMRFHRFCANEGDNTKLL